MSAIAFTIAVKAIEFECVQVLAELRRFVESSTKKLSLPYSTESDNQFKTTAQQTPLEPSSNTHLINIMGGIREFCP
jgi:hypothetical protein